MGRFSFKDLFKKVDSYGETLKWIDEHDEDDFRELMGFKKDYPISNTHPMFLTPAGNVLDVTDITGKTNHEHFAFALTEKVIDETDFYIDFPNKEEFEDLGIKTYYILVQKKGWIPLNPGSKSTGGTPYMLMKNPTNIQYTVMEEFLNKVWSNGKDKIEIQIYVSGEGAGAEIISKFYKFNEVFPEDIIKRIKRYYSSGRLEEELDK